MPEAHTRPACRPSLRCKNTAWDTWYRQAQTSLAGRSFLGEPCRALAAPNRHRSIAPTHRPTATQIKGCYLQQVMWAIKTISPASGIQSWLHAISLERLLSPAGRRLGCCRYHRAGRRHRAQLDRRLDRWRVPPGTRSPQDTAHRPLPQSPRDNSSPRCMCTGPCRLARPCRRSLLGTEFPPPDRGHS